MWYDNNPCYQQPAAADTAFSPVANLSRPYSQTRSNTQRALMQPDEVLRLYNEKSIVMLRGQFPMLLYKVTPPEFADFKKLRPVSITDYHSHTESTEPSDEENVPGSQQAESIKQTPAARATYPELLHLDEEDYATSYLFTNERFQEIQNELEKGDKEP